MADGSDFDPGCGEPVVVDMGAYEFPGTPFTSCSATSTATAPSESWT